MDKLTKKKTDRFRFLNRLYDVTDGNPNTHANMWEIGVDIGLDESETELAYSYLSGERLIEDTTLGGGIGITHQGVIEVERSLSTPENPTQYFPPVVNILNVTNMHGSQVQQGTSGSTLTYHSGAVDLEDLRLFVQELRTYLGTAIQDEEIRKETEADIKTIEAQLASSKPKTTIIGESLKSIVAILEGATGSVVASELLPKAAALLAGLF